MADFISKLVGFLFITALTFNCFAHSARTDSTGGHNCSAKSISKGVCSGYHSHNAAPNKPSYNQLQTTKYSRKDWPHWVDDDHDCQNTRAEILIRDSKEQVKFKRNKGCNVTWGKWLDPYTLQTFTKASDIDIDHIIPLSHAHRNGAAAWSKSKKRLFANDPENLLAVEDNANQQKSDKAPNEWLPSNKGYHCIYLNKWQQLKSKYGLTSSSREKLFVSSKLKLCH